jgi:diguanylate cyclase (GGDEF)-like protein/PAS domain S-box-containing protein
VILTGVARLTEELVRARAERDAAMRAAETAMRDTTRLTRLLTILSEPAPLDTLLDRTLSALSELFSADIVVLLGLPAGDSCKPVAAIGLPEDVASTPMVATPGSPLATVLREAKKVSIQAAGPDSLLLALGVQPTVWLPVTGTQAPLGVLVLGRCRPAPFSYADTELLAAMTHRIGLALEQAQRSLQLEQLVSAGHMVARNLDEDAVVSDAARLLPGVLRADAAATLRIDSATGAVHCETQVGLDPSAAQAWVCSFDEFQALAALANEEPFQIGDVRAPGAPWCPLPDSGRVRAVLVVPIRRDTAVERLLCAIRFTPEAFTADSVQLATLFAGQVAAALDNARLYRSARDELAVRTHAELALRASDERFRLVAQATNDAVWDWDLQTNGLWWSSSLETLFGHRPDTAGPDVNWWYDHIHPNDARRVINGIQAVIVSTGTLWTDEYRFRRADGSYADVYNRGYVLRDEQQIPTRMVGAMLDGTERKQAVAALEHQALHDRLTDLPNRSLLHDRLGLALSEARQNGAPLALLLLDLDRFKEVNDTLGHACGDSLLQQIGPRLRPLLRADETLARLGGDEFAVVLPGRDAADASALAVGLCDALAQPLTIDGIILDISASVGIAIFPTHGQDADTLLRRADVAMYVAKRAGSGHAVYESGADQHSLDRLALVAELRHAIDSGELVLHYQPKVDFADGTLVGLEALVRWHHPRRGLLAPDDFIPLAEQTGLIEPLSRWVLQAVLRQQQIWRRGGLEVPVAVNVSRHTLPDPGLADMVRDLLVQFELPSTALDLEITESGLMLDPVRASANLTRLRALGVRIAIDDFGTGYSSLASLKTLPVDQLKIDRSFIRDMATDAGARGIARAIIDLADDLGLRSVAEGVEDRATWEVLARLGCAVAQGYYISPPLPAAEVLEWVNKTAVSRLTLDWKHLEQVRQERQSARHTHLMAENEFLAHKGAEAVLRARDMQLTDAA